MKKRKIEVFTAGCPLCKDVVELVTDLSCESCEVEEIDVRNDTTKEILRSRGINSIPAVAVDGSLLSCCVGRGVDRNDLRSAGIGQPVKN